MDRKSALASLLSLSLVATSPGLLGTQAFAEVIGARAKAPRPSPAAAVPALKQDLSLPLPGALSLPAATLGALAAPLPQAVAVRAGAANLALPTALPAPAKPETARQAPRAAALSSARSAAKAGMASGFHFDGGFLRKSAAPEPTAGSFSPQAAPSGLEAASAASLSARPSASLPSPRKTDSSKGGIGRFLLPGALLGGFAALLSAPLSPAILLGASLITAVAVHEIGHLWAVRRPDLSSLNPLPHIDPVGTVLVPAATMLLSTWLFGVPLFLGWTRPVPVSVGPAELAGDRRKPERAALMGPALNAAFGLLAGAAFLAFPAPALLSLFQANIAVAAFNLLPLPWLDGGKWLLSRVLPKRAYERWVATAHLHHLEDLGAVSRVALLAGIAAVAGPLFYALGLPLLFLALPCGFDYWCIYEKVRSQKAVQNMMDFMSQWGGMLSEIAEDLGAKTEVDKRQAELTLVYAVDKLLEKLMEQSDFKALGEKEKAARFMREFPGFAVPLLHQHVFTEDDLGTVERIFGDPRNESFLKRLEAWLLNPEGEENAAVQSIFEKMASPHARDKFQEALEKAKRAAGGSAPLLLLALGLAAQLAGAHAAGASALMLGFLGLLGTTIEGGAPRAPEDPFEKLSGNISFRSDELWLTFRAGLEYAVVNSVAEDMDLIRASYNSSGDGISRLQFYVGNEEVLQRAIALALRDDRITAISVRPEVAERARGRAVLEAAAAPRQAPAPTAADAASKLHGKPLSDRNELTVNFAQGVDREAADSLVQAWGIDRGQVDHIYISSFHTYKFNLDDQAMLEALPGILAETRVMDAGVHPDLVALYEARRARTADAALAAPVSKIRAGNFASREISLASGRSVHHAVVEFDAPLSQAAEILGRHRMNLFRANFQDRAYDNAEVGDAWSQVRILSETADDLKAVVQQLAANRHVRKILVHDDVLRELPVQFVAANPERTEDAPPAATEPERATPPIANVERAVVAVFRPWADAEIRRAYAERFRLRVVQEAYEGGPGVLLELPVTGTRDWLVRTLQATAQEAGSPLESLVPLKALSEAEIAVAPPAPPAAPSASQPAPAPAARSRRDPRAAWLAYLNSKTREKGGKLTDDDVAFLASLLEPIIADGPIIGRVPEIRAALPTLLGARGSRTSVLLAGAPNVGKTAVAEGIAQLLADDPERWVVNLDIGVLLDQEKPTAALRELVRLLGLLNDADARNGNAVILFMDEFHRIAPLADALKVPMGKGLVSILGATTDKEYKKFVEKDEAWQRRALKVEVGEADPAMTLRILRGIKRHLEDRHSGKIDEDVLLAAPKLTQQFMKSSQNPGKTIDLLIQVLREARPSTLRRTLGAEISDLWRELADAARDASEALRAAGSASALALPADHYNRIAELTGAIVGLYDRKGEVQDGPGRVTLDRFKAMLAQITGIHAGQLSLGEEDLSRYVAMEENLAKEVVNQDHAIAAMAGAIRRNKAGLSEPGKPIGKFFWVGPTGVGKTYLAKRLAKYLFKDERLMHRIDMSEYTDRHHADKLTGAPPGYVGYGEGGQLTEFVRKHPHCVVLLDEIEKAHPDVWNVLLQVLDDGRLTDSEGRTVDFSNVVIIASSNVGMQAVNSGRFEERLKKSKDLPERYQIEAEWDAEIKKAIAEGIKTFRPEFMNRWDRAEDLPYIVFNRLNERSMRIIAKLQLSDFQNRLREMHGTELEYGPEVIDVLMERGFSAVFGARPMQAAVNNLVVNPLAQFILKEIQSGNASVRGGLVHIGVKDGALVFSAKPNPPKPVDKKTLAGRAVNLLTQGVLGVVEALAGAPQDGPAPVEPSEELFGGMLEDIRASQNEESTAEVAPEAKKPEPLLRRDTPITFPPSATVVLAGALKPNAKDLRVVAAEKDLADSAAAAGWSEQVRELIKTPVGSQATGWLRRFARLAKVQTAAANLQASINVHYSVDAGRIRLAVHSAHALTDRERELFERHFTGEPPASFREAQERSDTLGRGSGDTEGYDRDLYDLYRRTLAIPGARLGYATGALAQGGKGTDYWLEIAKDVPAEAAGPTLSEDQARARDKIMEMLHKRILQEGEDGPVLRGTAARIYAMLSGPEHAAVVRRWAIERGWHTYDSMDYRQWPQIAAMAGVLGRHGAVSDLEFLENLAGRFTNLEHQYEPLRAALIEAAESLYAQLGLETVRSLIKNTARIDDSKLKTAVRRALGRIGTPADLEAVKDDPEALAALAARHPELKASLLEHSWPPRPKLGSNLSVDWKDTAWKSLSNDLSIALLRLVAGGTRQTPDEDLEMLRKMMHNELLTQRVVHHAEAEAFADIALREGRIQGLAGAFEAYLTNGRVTTFQQKWPVLLALVYISMRAADPEALPWLEKIMRSGPAGIQYEHEQAFYEAPIAWAQTAVFSGRFADLTRPREEAGVAKPPLLEEMLASNHPMLVAAAAYALALAQAVRQDPEGTRRRLRIRDANAPASPLPDIVGRIDPSEGMHQNYDGF